jgi:hypothetical protein
MDPSTGTLLALFILLAPSTLLHAVAPKVPDLKIKTRRVGDSGSWWGRSPALRTARGRYDLTKPDTSAIRVEVYWAELELWTRRWFP